MPKKKVSYTNRDISWLSFNARVLQEANDRHVPLLEKVKFLGIFSSNLDEFFRVRVATLKRALQSRKQAEKVLKTDPQEILDEIHERVVQLQELFEQTYQKILADLAAHQIWILNEKQLSKEQEAFVREYFRSRVQPSLVPIIMGAHIKKFPYLKDKSIYFAIYLAQEDRKKYALIEIPSGDLSRFVVLPSPEGTHQIILLDDVIRLNLDQIFAVFDFETIEAYTIKLTRDAELDIHNDAFESYIDKISKSLKQRKRGRPVRFVYDETMPTDLLQFFGKKLGLTQRDNWIPGGRYHNFKDFIDFPTIGSESLRYPPFQTVAHQGFQDQKSLLNAIKQRDIMLHYPYHSFDSMIDLLREAAIDPKVEAIKMTLYRVAKNSNIVNALINAVKNGTDVTVVMELQARFDEEANIYWANKLEEEGAKVLYGVPGYKVHAKLCLIRRVEQGKRVHYANLSTGNYNEVTSRFYSDCSLFTADPRITNEISQIFQFFEDNIKVGRYQHLVVSPFQMRKRFLRLIDNEISYAKQGLEAYIYLKINSLVDQEMIDKLYLASCAGVKIHAIVRSNCSVVPNVPELSENIEVISIVGRFLEHTRLMVFCNGGDPLYYLTSADWMNRNLNHRIEVACPIYDASIQEEIRSFFDIQLRDNCKARILDEQQRNVYKKKGRKKVHAQEAFRDYLEEKTQEAS